MITEFIFSSLLVCIVLYASGFLVLRAGGLSIGRSIAFAPVVSIVLYSLLGVLYDKLSIHASGWSVGLPILVLALLVYAIAYICRKRNKNQTRNIKPQKSQVLFCIAYVAMGVLAYVVIYMSALPSFDNVAETYDTVFHYNLIRSFVESGSWSTLNASTYLDVPDTSPFTTGGVYYPAAWHLICSFPVSVLDAPVGVAVNAVNCVFVAVVYPLSMYQLLDELFIGNRLYTVLGIIVTFAFGAFPWVLLIHWPLFPNLISMCMAPLLCRAFLKATKQSARSTQRIRWFVLFLFGIITAGFCQPNTVFVVMVLLAPYVVYAGSRAIRRCFVSRRACKHQPSSSGRGICLAAGVIITMAIIAFWFVLTSLPFLRSTVNYYWAPIMTVSQAVASSLSLSLALPYPQYALGVLVLIGIVFILLKKRDYLWLVFSYALTLIIFVVAASFENVWFKHFLSGFWYTDPYRTAAMVGLAGVPIATMGLAGLCVFLHWIISRAKGDKKQALSRRTTMVINCFVIVVVCCALYIPGVMGRPDTGMFLQLRHIAKAQTAGTEWAPYEDEEKAFVEEVKKIINEDDVVLNNPFDGSMMSYGLNGLPVYYRSISDYGSPSETEDSIVLREHMSDLETDEAVQDALDNVSADYLLVLENDQQRMELFYPTYGQASWIGFESIDEHTPGLELVLSDGEMKLYKIAAS